MKKLLRQTQRQNFLYPYFKKGKARGLHIRTDNEETNLLQFFLSLIVDFGISPLDHWNKATAALPPVPEELVAKKVPLATQDIGLRLVGTVVANNPEDSLAIIEVRTKGKQYPRREGDRVGKASPISAQSTFG